MPTKLRTAYMKTEKCLPVATQGVRHAPSRNRRSVMLKAHLTGVMIRTNPKTRKMIWMLERESAPVRVSRRPAR